MHETGGSGYRRLSRSSLGGVPITRNVASFVFLISLVIFVSIFYLYISTSSDLQELRQDYANQGDYATKLKNELLELNMKVETVQNAENDCKGVKTALDSKYQECLSDLGHQKSAVADMEGSLRDKDTTISNLRTQLDESTKLVSSLKANITSLQAQNLLVQDTANLSNAITTLKNEIFEKDTIIAQLKSNITSKLQTNNVLPIANDSNVKMQDLGVPPKGDMNIAPLPDTESLHEKNVPASGSQAKAVGVAPPMIEAKNLTTVSKNIQLGDEQNSNMLGEAGAPVAEDSVKAGEVNSLEMNGGEPAVGAQAAANNQNEAELSNEIRSGQGEFLAERQPGARVKLEENIQAKENHPQGEKADDSPLLKAVGDANPDEGVPGESAPDRGEPDNNNNNNEDAAAAAAVDDDDSNKLQ